jgi:hypothetical protein
MNAGRAIYQIIADELHSDAEEVDLEYIARVDEAEFPPYFASALIYRLAAEFCLPLTENAMRAELLFNLAHTELRLAKMIDSQRDDPESWACELRLLEEEK